MRTFLVSLLKDLKRKRGSNQYNDIMYMDGTTEEAQRELDLLLDSLVGVCQKHPYSCIPQKAMEKAISDHVEDDKEFYGLNVAFIKKSLNPLVSIYLKESGHQETNDLLSKEMTGVPPPKEFIEYTKQLGAMVALKEVPSVTKHDLKKIQQEDENRLKNESKSKGYDWRTKSEQINAEKARLKVALESRGLDKLTDLSGLKSFEIEGIAVWARNKEEAQEIYVEVYI